MIRTDLIRPIADLLEQHRRERGERTAFSDAGRSVSYAELEDRTARLAAGFRRLGLQQGDRVALYLGNGVAMAEAQLAAVRAGAVAVPINAQAPEPEVAFMAADSGARILVVDGPRTASIARLRTEAPDIEHAVVVADAALEGTHSFESLATGPDRVDAGLDLDLDLDAPAWMVYTSGTTGRPKGVLLSQRSCLWVTAACWAPVIGLNGDDEMLSALPLFHSYAIVLTVISIVAVGASVKIMERFSPRAVLDCLSTAPFTVLPGVPTMFHYLVNNAPPAKLGCETLRVCVSAGAIMSADLNRHFEEVTGVPLLDGYGITETSTMVTMNWPQGHRPAGSCGLPLLGSALRIVDPNTGEDLPAGTDGELWVRGPHVMLGYHERPADTERVLEGGWYHTGDLGRVDQDGYVTITGRIKEMIIRGGENIYPSEVEAVIMAHPDVVDCAVVGQPHAALGEIVAAFIVARDAAIFDHESVRRHCGEYLASYKVPVEIHLIDEIPRTGSGKTQRHRLAILLTPAG